MIAPGSNHGPLQIRKSMYLLLDMIFNPLLENNQFKQEYVNSEKNNIKTLIESKIDNKDMYALSRCAEEMYKGQPYGLYKYGYSEDLPDITPEILYAHYLKLIKTSKIDIYVSGDINDKETREMIQKNQNIARLDERDASMVVDDKKMEIRGSARKIEEKMDIGQGKLVIGMDVHLHEKNAKFPTSIYNVILGESATSKLFQNVREKASLAYTIRSNYVRQKNNIYIRAGIEVEKYDEALEIINGQLEDMKQGNFTEEEIENAKKYMISGIKAVQDEQDSEVTYYIGQELSRKFNYI